MPYSVQLLFICLFASAAASQLQATASVEPSSEKKTVVACDGQTERLQCPANTIIEVNSAFYGRRGDEHCPTGPRLNNNCDIGPRALRTVASRCDDLQSCSINGGEIGGDPCKNTHKYLLVTFTCKPLKTTVSCDDTSLKMECPPCHYIWVHDAFFGRVSDEHCNRGPRADYNCTLPAAKSLISGVCNNKHSCEVHSSTLPDPCVGTFKYMTASYECRAYETPDQMKHACDGDVLSISCPTNRVIRVYSVFYGRHTDEYCAKGPRTNYKCSSASAEVAMYKLCHNKPSCSFRVDGSLAEDPCWGTYKYAIVRYRCM